MVLKKIQLLQEREAATDRETRLQGKNRLLRSGHYRLQGEKRADAKSISSAHAQITLLTAQVSSFALIMTHGV